MVEVSKTNGRSFQDWCSQNINTHVQKQQGVPTLDILCASPTSKWIELGNLWPGQHLSLPARHMAGGSKQWCDAYFHMANRLKMVFVILKSWEEKKKSETHHVGSTYLKYLRSDSWFVTTVGAQMYPAWVHASRHFLYQPHTQERPKMPWTGEANITLVILRTSRKEAPRNELQMSRERLLSPCTRGDHPVEWLRKSLHRHLSWWKAVAATYYCAPGWVPLCSGPNYTANGKTKMPTKALAEVSRELKKFLGLNANCYTLAWPHN